MPSNSFFWGVSCLSSDEWNEQAFSFMFIDRSLILLTTHYNLILFNLNLLLLIYLDTRLSIFETGIKVVDLLEPYTKGGKTGLFGGAGVGKTVLI